MVRNRVLALVMAAGGLCVGACGADGPMAPRQRIASLELSPAETTVAVGSDFQLRIVAKDAAGTVIREPTVAFTSSVDSVASTTQSGMVAANFVGRTTLRLRAEGSSLSDTAVINVAPQIIDIPFPPGATAVQVTGVNDSRTVVGETFHVPVRAFIYTPAGGTRYLQVPDSRGISTAQAVNNAGIVVGGYNPTGFARTLMWDASGQVTDLGDFGGSSPFGGGAVAYAINSTDVVLINHSYGSALYDLRTRELTPILVPAGMDRLHSADLSDDGAVIALSERSGQPCKSLVWTRSSGFESLPGCASMFGIANGKRVVGAYYWDPSLPQLRGIETLGGRASGLYAINNDGVAVGQSETADRIVHAVLWTKDGRIIDLGATIPYVSWATAISPGGVVAGVIQLNEAPQRWKPVIWILRRP